MDKKEIICLHVFRRGEVFEKLMNEDVREILDGMARFGFIGGRYEAYVRTDDAGQIPHMHIWDCDSRGQLFHTCIRLDKPEYYHHTGKEDMLDPEAKKDLISFLEEKHRAFDITNYHYALMLWNLNNPSAIQIDENQKMPDYMRL